MNNNNAFNLQWLQKIDAENFESKALKLFVHQCNHIPIYGAYCKHIGINAANVKTLKDIPFLPISLFKSHTVAGQLEPNTLHFESSGTTGMIPSKHFVPHPEYYEFAFLQGFKEFYGDPSEYIILGLLPSYLERQHSSLVYMVNDLIQKSNSPESGFYLDEWGKLAGVLQNSKGKKIFLIGVTFALLDFAAAFPMDLHHCIVMETGGMKGRRAEWTRMEVHDFLKQQWHLNVVHSEYGMSELLSQAYSKGDGKFRTSTTMKILLRDENDPLTSFEKGSGCINVIDLANIDSCAFIATEDIAKVDESGQFEVLGRRDVAALRGCSLMVV
jgi:hypothetical protein